LQISLLNRGIACPNCGQYTEEIHRVLYISQDLPVFGNTVYLKFPGVSFPVKLVKVTVLNDWILLTGSDDIRGGMKKIFINELKTYHRTS